MPTAQEILNQVTGSDAYLSSALSGGNVPQTYGNNYSPASSAPQNTNSVTIPLYSGDSGPSFNDYLGTFIDGFTHPFDTLTGNRSAAKGIDTGAKITATEQGASALLAIVTDIPRMITLIIGLILLAAGLFLLGAKPVVNIVESVRGAIP